MRVNISKGGKVEKIKDDRGPLDLTRRIDDLEKENIKIKKKLKEERAHNKEMLNYP